MLSSLDGKISTGDTDKRDVDKDFPTIQGIKEGLFQYYQLEKKTDFNSLNTGKVMAKIGINKKQKIQKIPINFIIIDNYHLTPLGVSNLLKKCNALFLVTSNPHHPAFKVTGKNIQLLFFPKIIDFPILFKKLKQEYGIQKVTIQSGGTLNSLLVRKGLIDRVSLVIAPALIGGKNTPTLIDGKSLRTATKLKLIKSLKLIKINKLKNSYLHLVYDITN